MLWPVMGLVMIEIGTVGEIDTDDKSGEVTHEFTDVAPGIINGLVLECGYGGVEHKVQIHKFLALDLNFFCYRNLCRKLIW